MTLFWQRIYTIFALTWGMILRIENKNANRQPIITIDCSKEPVLSLRQPLLPAMASCLGMVCTHRLKSLYFYNRLMRDPTTDGVGSGITVTFTIMLTVKRTVIMG